MPDEKQPEKPPEKPKGLGEITILGDIVLNGKIWTRGTHRVDYETGMALRKADAKHHGAPTGGMPNDTDNLLRMVNRLQSEASAMRLQISDLHTQIEELQKAAAGQASQVPQYGAAMGAQPTQ